MALKAGYVGVLPDEAEILSNNADKLDKLPGIETIGSGLNLNENGELSADGGGSSTLADLTDVDIDDLTLADGQILQYDATGQKWKNGTYSAFIEVDVTLHSAANDTVIYTDDVGTKTVTTNSSGVGATTILLVNDSKSITFTSSVAKNPSDLSQAYSKTLTVDENTTSIKVMPGNALYWYGNQCTDLTGGWENPGTYAANTYTPEAGNTFNTNSITLSEPVSNNKLHVSGVQNQLNKGDNTKISFIWNNEKHDFDLTADATFYVGIWSQKANNMYWQNAVEECSAKNVCGVNMLAHYSDYVAGTPATSKTIYAIWLE